MPFVVANLILLLLSLLIYSHFRVGVYSYCRLSKMSKTNIRKSKKGFLNYWLYAKLHKQKNLGALYYLNLIYLFTLLTFIFAVALSWIPILEIPVIIVGFLLCITSVPVFIAGEIYLNIENVGQPFVIFRTYKLFGKTRFSAITDWLFCIFPLAFYILCMIKFF